MTQYIILSAAELASVQGSGLPRTWLAPRRTLLGDYALPLSVLTDPGHAAKRDFPASRPRRTITELQWFLIEVIL